MNSSMRLFSVVLFVSSIFGCSDDKDNGQDGAVADMAIGSTVDMTAAADLVAADLVAADLAGADLAGADLSTVADMATSGPMTVTVTVGPSGGLSFDPASVTIKVGDTVHWVWASSGHTVNSGSGGTSDGTFCSPDNLNCGGNATSNMGATYDRTFNAAGTFPYFCRPHSGVMTGTIVVQ